MPLHDKRAIKGPWERLPQSTLQQPPTCLASAIAAPFLACLYFTPASAMGTGGVEVGNSWKSFCKEKSKTLAVVLQIHLPIILQIQLLQHFCKFTFPILQMHPLHFCKCNPRIFQMHPLVILQLHFCKNLHAFCINASPKPHSQFALAGGANAPI